MSTRKAIKCWTRFLKSCISPPFCHIEPRVSAFLLIARTRTVIMLFASKLENMDCAFSNLPNNQGKISKLSTICDYCNVSHPTAALVNKTGGAPTGVSTLEEFTRKTNPCHSV